MSIFGIGTVVVDHVVELSHYPAEDTKVEIQRQWVQVGGPVPVALSTAAFYGSATSLLSRWGKDAAGDLIQSTLMQRGISLDHCEAQSGWDSGFAHVWVTPRSCCRTIAYSRGQFPVPDQQHVKEAMLKNCSILHLDGWASGAAIQAAKIVGRHGGTVVLDAGSVKPGLEDLLPEVDVLIASALFQRSYFGSETVSTADLVSLGVPSVIATDGACGARWLTVDSVLSEPGMSVDAIDTNGAGDIFAGCILYGLNSGLPRRETLRFANRVAGYSCTQRGNSALPELVPDLFAG